MEKPAITIGTERPEIVLREFSTEADDEAFFALIDANRQHFSAFGDHTADTYPDVESVRLARLLPLPPGILRLGIWLSQETLIGASVISPFLEGVEMGCLMGAEFSGKGYARVAQAAVINFIRDNQLGDIFCETQVDNVPAQNLNRRFGFVQDSKTEWLWRLNLTEAEH